MMLALILILLWSLGWAVDAVLALPPMQQVYLYLFMHVWTACGLAIMAWRN